MIVQVKAQLAGMRKPQDFVVYPNQNPKLLVVQSDRAIGIFDRKTGAGLLNWRGSHPKYFLHLDRRTGAERYQFPEAFRLMCLEMRPNSGDLIGTTPEGAPVYIA